MVERLRVLLDTAFAVCVFGLLAYSRQCMNLRQLILLCVLAALAAGCTDRPVEVELAMYEDPSGRYSLLVPIDWNVAPGVGQWNLLLGEPSAEASRPYDATVSVTWGPLPCDAMLVDDVLAWYADKLCAGEDCQELSRVEVDIDGRRALRLHMAEELTDSGYVQRLILLCEGYGVVWQVICQAEDGVDYDRYEALFDRIVHSLRVYGSWSQSDENG